MINSGVAFGLFPGISLWVVALVLVSLIIFAVKMRELWGRVGVGLIIVGGAGNLVSRWVNGGVVDNWNFLGLFFNNIWDWIIVSGLIIYAVQYFRTIGKLRKSDHRRIGKSD